MDPHFLAKTLLFRGIDPEEIQAMSSCLGFREAEYPRGSVVYLTGDTNVDIGVVLSGAVQIESNDLWGTKSILGIVGPGGVFAESYACCPEEPLMVDAVAVKDSRVLFVDVKKVFLTCPTPCGRHTDVIRNLVAVSSRKNIRLSQRILDTSSKTIRGRLISYLSREVHLQGSRELVIPFDRQQLADYLGVDRSALSKELGKMKRDGLLDYRKNRFTIRSADLQLELPPDK